MDDLKDCNVLITGVAGQLGSALSKGFASAGCRVFGTDIGESAPPVGIPNEGTYRRLDIRNDGEVRAVFHELEEESGGLDVIINNAGVSVSEPFEERSEEEFDWVTDVNLKGTFNCIRAFAGLRKGNRRNNASIVNVASIYGLVSPDFRIYLDYAGVNSEIYGASKAGVIQMTKYFAVRLAEYGIRVNCVSPGGIFNEKTPQGDEFVKAYSERCPMGRMAKAEEMVGAVLFLSGSSASYVNGQNLVVDGGMSAW
jgi:NAD(P)-dependent dehydrogenase (short-subunit alcohol dehydrogenase family)